MTDKMEIRDNEVDRLTLNHLSHHTAHSFTIKIAKLGTPNSDSFEVSINLKYKVFMAACLV